MVIDKDESIKENESNKYHNHNIEENSSDSPMIEESTQVAITTSNTTHVTNIMEASQSLSDESHKIQQNSVALNIITIPTDTTMNLESLSTLHNTNVDINEANNDSNERCNTNTVLDSRHESTEQNNSSARTTKASNTRKTRTDETPFEFKATSNPDVVDNPA